MHGIAVLLEVEEACGGWNRILELPERTETAVEANLATPCRRNARSLLVTALAAGSDVTTRRRGTTNAAPTRSPPKATTSRSPRRESGLHCCGTRSTRQTVSSRLIWPAAKRGTRSAAAAARLDALAALREPSLVERDAPALLRPGIYLQPFAMRALGLVRQDEALIEQAVDRFKAIGLTWHA